MMAKRGFYLQTHFSCSAIHQYHSIDFYSYQYPLILNNLLLILNIIHYLYYFLAVLITSSDELNRINKGFILSWSISFQ